MDAEQTLADHELRESDAYAHAKYRLTLRWLRAAPRGSRLANIGCGSGLFNQLAVDAGFRVDGFEPDPAAYALALRHLPDHDCSLHNVGLEGITGATIVDVIVMHDVLEHIADERGAVEHVRRLVKDDGRVVISVPAMPRLYGFHDEMLGHERRYTRRSLRSALEHDFEIIRMRSFGFAFIPLTLYYSRWRRRPYPIEEHGGSGLAGRAVRTICAVEEYVPLPIGTSLVCEARPR